MDLSGRVVPTPCIAPRALPMRSWSTNDSGDSIRITVQLVQAERFLFTRVVALEGSISGEHGIGFAKAPYLPLELSADEIALMKRVKAAFDPNGILNPGKIFP